MELKECDLAPIILFVYKRLSVTRKVVESLLRNRYASSSTLFIFSDGAKGQKDVSKVEEVRDYIKTIRGFKSLTIEERSNNIGLHNNYVSGVNKVFEKYNKVIVIEDDIDTHPYFLDYANTALIKYEDNKKVFSISGDNLSLEAMPIPEDTSADVYFNPRMACWSFAVWKDRWELAEWDTDFKDYVDKKELKRQYSLSGGTLLRQYVSGIVKDSWDTRLDYVQNKYRSYSLRPVRSLINNIGFGEDATHTIVDYPILYTDLSYSIDKPFSFPEEVLLNSKLLDSFNRFHNRRNWLRYFTFPIQIISKLPFGEKLINLLRKIILG